jgi:hypothetical protein
MTTINLQLELTGVQVGNLHPFVRDKIGFLSSIMPDPILMAAFAVGTGFQSPQIDFAWGDDKNYDKNKIKGKGNNQKNSCKVIATVGGVVTSDAVTGGTAQNYVSLVGSADGITDPNIKGGVTLGSYKLDGARKNYLKGLPGGIYNDANIFLYTNPNSSMHAAEKAAWNSNGTFFESASGQSNGTNDPSQFANDFAGGSPIVTTAKGLIISDDPFFRSNRAELIKQVNSWLGGDPSRYVIYPSQIYGSPVLNDSTGTPQQPTSGRGTLYGPDLISAYQLLGILARCSFDNETASFGFVSAVPFVVPL